MHQRKIPQLFNQVMVLALLANIKQQTRRPMSRQPDKDVAISMEYYNPTVISKAGHLAAGKLTYGALWCNGERGAPSIFGAPGDLLYVRESFAFNDAHSPDYSRSIEFRADNKVFALEGQTLLDVPHESGQYHGPWKPSLHMPQWAARIWLEVAQVRVELVQDITEEDAAAEGMAQVVLANPELQGKSMREVFQWIWDSIYGDGEHSWESNPYVWVGCFKPLTFTGKLQEKALQEPLAA